MSHSHMPVRHLLRQVEIYRSNREQRDVRPEWVTELIERVADLFEPLADEARVGYDCQLTEDRWVIEMFLGATELIGGPRDGQSRFTNFQFDLHNLLDLFATVDRFRWNSFPEKLDDEGTPRSSVMIEGNVDGNMVRLHIYSFPPEDAGPGFRELADGTVKPA